MGWVDPQVGFGWVADGSAEDVVVDRPRRPDAARSHRTDFPADRHQVPLRLQPQRPLERLPGLSLRRKRFKRLRTKRTKNK